MLERSEASQGGAVLRLTLTLSKRGIDVTHRVICLERGKIIKEGRQPLLDAPGWGLGGVWNILSLCKRACPVLDTGETERVFLPHPLLVPPLRVRRGG